MHGKRKVFGKNYTNSPNIQEAIRKRCKSCRKRARPTNNAAAAFMLGAVGVQVGTRFLIADECIVHDNYKEKLIKASDVSTIVTGKSLGDAVRCLKTPFSKKFFKMEYDPAVPKEEVLDFGKGAMRKAVFEGDNMGSYLAGEVAGMIHKRESAKDIVEDIMGGAEKLLKNAPSLII